MSTREFVVTITEGDTEAEITLTGPHAGGMAAKILTAFDTVRRLTNDEYEAIKSAWSSIRDCTKHNIDSEAGR